MIPRIRRAPVRPSAPLVALAVVSALSSSTLIHIASATTDAWLNPLGGSWQNTANWQNGALPGSGNDAVFNLGTDYSVTFTADAAAKSLLIQNDGLTLASGNHTLTAGGDIKVGELGGSRLTLVGGTLNQTAGNLYPGDQNVGAFYLQSNATLSSAGTLNAGDTNGSFGKVLLIASGSALTTGNAGLATNPLAAVLAELDDPNSRWTVNGNLNVGSIAAGASAGAAALTINTGATVSVSGTTKVWNSSTISGVTTLINLNGGTLATGTLNTGGDSTRLNWTGGTLDITGSNLSINSSGDPFGNDCYLNAGKTLRISGLGTALTVGSSGMLNVIGGSLYTHSLNLLNNSSSSFIGGSVTIDGGTLTAPANYLLHVNNSWKLINAASAPSTSSIIIIGQGGYSSTPGTLSIETASAATFSAGLVVGESGGLQPFYDNMGHIVGYTPFSPGTGTLSLSGGSSLHTTDSSIGVANNYGSSTATATVSGANTTWTNSGNITVDGPLSTMTVSNSAQLTVAGNLTLQNNASLNLAGGTITTAALTRDGPFSPFNWTSGTLWINNPLTLANSNIGTSPVIGPNKNLTAATITTPNGTSLTLSGGTIYTNSLDTAGDPSRFVWTSGTLGFATVFTPDASNIGVNATIHAGQTLQVSNNLTTPVAGTLTVSGGIVNVGSFTLGASDGSANSGNLVINNGGTVTTTFEVIVGTGTGTNTVTVDGVGSSLVNTEGDINVGGDPRAESDSGNGTLLVTNGASVTSFGTTIGSSDSTGTIIVAGNNATLNAGYSLDLFPSLSSSATLTINPGGIVNVSGATTTYQSTATINLQGGILNTDMLDLSQGGAFNWTSGTLSITNGGAILGILNLIIPSNGLLKSTGPLNLTSLTINGAAQLLPFGATPNTSKLFALTLAGSTNNWTGALDLTSAKLILETTSQTKAAALATLQNQIQSYGHSGSLGITSSTLPQNFALALLDNALTHFSTFAGQPVDANSLLLSPELLGDANADGHVDATDLNTVLSHFGQPTPNWTDGNFDYAPTIDLTDLAYVLNNFGLSNPNTSTSQSSALSPQSRTHLHRALAPRNLAYKKTRATTPRVNGID